MARVTGGRRRARKLAYYRQHGRETEAEAVRAEMRANQECLRCGIVLEDPESIKREYGKFCYGARDTRPAPRARRRAARKVA